MFVQRGLNCCSFSVVSCPSWDALRVSHKCVFHMTTRPLCSSLSSTDISITLWKLLSVSSRLKKYWCGNLGEIKKGAHLSHREMPQLWNGLLSYLPSVLDLVLSTKPNNIYKKHCLLLRIQSLMCCGGNASGLVHNHSLLLPCPSALFFNSALFVYTFCCLASFGQMLHFFPSGGLTHVSWLP